MGEAKTQRFVAQYLEANDIPTVRAPRVYIAFTWGDFGFIVTEYIDGPICVNSDVALVAAAVQSLIAIPSPSSTLRPVSGDIHQPDVVHLVRVRSGARGSRQRYFIRHGEERACFLRAQLCLCPSDLNRAKRDRGPRLWRLQLPAALLFRLRARPCRPFGFHRPHR
ncbi:hypothetical protein EDB92DRAFT_296942 [Lactarius akahatsu]|uniref:Uncharacterized protein n=1 Tax=Lactarius akahatsu TaxID=416441 RepID=A0AAD4LKV0_9AGAM|nr:hypothetical protein EDB92DRAFT_296942 [Lactarius akahatsu]